MYCSKCGKEISNDTIYCYNCGYKLGDIITKDNESLNSTSPLAEPAISELNEKLRKGTSIYLNKILQFEFICKKLREKANDTDAKILSKEQSLGWKYYPHADLYNCSEHALCHTFSSSISFTANQTNGGFGFHHSDSDPQILRAILYCGDPVSPYPESGCEYVWYDFSSTDRENLFTGELVTQIKTKGLIFTHSENVVSDVIWNIVGNPIVFGQTIYGAEKQIFRNRSSARTAWLEDLEDYKRCKSTLISEQKKEIVELKKARDVIQNEINEATGILNSLYDVNIIPKKFRNLKAIYSICDYFDSSIETLSFILFHLDLDEMMSKLDDVINKQQEIVINQTVMISQNEEMIIQNDSVLCELADLTKSVANNSAYLAHIEDNTAKAANWASIAADNAEACAWLGMAHYFKN